MACNRGKKLTALSIQQKLDIVQKLDNGELVNALATAYRVHPKTIRCIRRNKLALHRLDNKGVHIRRMKKVRKSKYDELENRLLTWFLERRVLGDRISDLLLQEKAIEMATQFAGTTGFKASRGWVAKFKNRHGIRLVNIYGEKGTPVTEEEPTDPLEAQLAIIKEEHTEQIVIEYLETCEETETVSAEEIEEINDQQNGTQQEEPLEEEEEEEGDEEDEEGEEEKLVPEEEEPVPETAQEEAEPVPETEQEEEPVPKTEQEEEEPVPETEREEDVRQESLHQVVSSGDRRIRRLVELLDDLHMHAWDESEFIQDTIVNLRNHFLRSKKK